ncbi:sugar phosphate isomerase/epimerase family protein [Palleronia sp. KMU-117]|uniref:sugar phosphate isomerase/epimerase family protein n=1 Tax=Palleronia sp. KMU-117 TaxID=3434108 RepID=UPI003D705BB7
MGPLVACNELLAGDGLDFEGQCRVAAALGYGGLELAPATLGPDPLGVSDAALARMARIAADHGLIIAGLHWLLTPFPDLSITDPARAAATQAAMLRLCDICAALGGSVMVHGSPRQRVPPPDEATEALLDRVGRLFRPVAEHAGALGLTYCIEALSPDQTPFLTTLAEAAQLVARVDHPAFVTMIDTSSAGLAEAEAVPDLIRRWLPTGLIGHVHLNDTNRGAPGMGQDDFHAILAALADAGWQGPLSIEPFVIAVNGTATLAIGAATVRAHLSTLGRTP